MAVQDTFATPAVRQSKAAEGTDVESIAVALDATTASGSLLLAAVRAKARPKREQEVEGEVATDEGEVTASATWDSATTSGSLLLAVVVGADSSPTGGVTIATPTGWTARTSIAATNWTEPDTENVRVSVFEIVNASSRSGAESFDVTGTSDFGTPDVYAQVFLIEVSGIATSSAFDVSATNSGTDTTTASTGTTSATGQADEYVLAVIANDVASNGQSLPSGYTEVAEEHGTYFRTGLYEKVVDTTGAQSASSTLTFADDFIGLIVTYKALGTAPTITNASGDFTSVQTDTEGSTRTTLFHIVGADPRSALAVLTFDRSCIAEAHLLEYTGGLTHDTGISAVASGTSTAPSVSDATSTSPAAGQHVLVIGVLGVGTQGIVQSAPTDGMQHVEGDECAVYSEDTTASAAQSFGATLASSAPWVAIITAYESAQQSSSGGYFVVAHDDGTNFDILSIGRDALPSGTWNEFDSVAVTDRSQPVAFASGLGHILYTHPGMSATRKWDGATDSNVGGTPPEGRCAAFYGNRFFIGEGTTLHFSALGDEDDWTTADDAGTTEVSEADGENIEDLLPMADGLLIAKRTTLWMLSGTGPENFALHRIGGANGGYAGRSLCQTPYGAVIAGKHRVWLWSGGEPQPISAGVETSYNLGGDYVTTACVGEVAYICDEGTGTIWAYDLSAGTWTTETVDADSEKPSTIASHNNLLLYGPQAGTVTSLLAYKDLAAGARQRDAGLAETLVAQTGEMWPGGPSHSHTPRHLYLELRQRGGDSGDAPLEVTPYYNGTAGTAQEIDPKDGGHQTFRIRVDLGAKAGIYNFAVRFEQAMTTTDAACLEVERGLLVLDVSERAW